MKAKRDIFSEMMEGVAAMKGLSGRQAQTSAQPQVEASPLPKVDSKLLRDTRRGCAARERCSRASYASTKERWKNGSRAARKQILRRPRWRSRAQISGYAGTAGRGSGRMIWEAPTVKPRSQRRDHGFGEIMCATTTNVTSRNAPGISMP